MADAMRRSPVIRLIVVLAMALLFAVPAFESRACAPVDDVGPAAVQVTGADVCGDCGDCGLSCAHGCCHASHPALTPTAPVVTPKAASALRVDWPPTAGWADRTPGGPERPPRV